MTLQFAPDEYEVPKSGGGSFFRFQEGENIIRITSNLVRGWQYWDEDKHPHYSREGWETLPADARKDKEGKVERARHIWVVSLISGGKHQIAEIRQSTVQEAILDTARDTSWGHPCQYDLKIDYDKSKAAALMYAVRPMPTEALSREELEEYYSNSFDLEQVFFESKDAVLGDQPDRVLGEIGRTMLNQYRNRLRVSLDDFKAAVASVQGLSEPDTSKLNNNQALQLLALLEPSKDAAALDGVPF